MASVVTNAGVSWVLDGTVTWTVGEVRARLCVAGAIDPDASSMVGYVPATGAVDQVIKGRTRVIDAGTNRIVFGGDGVQWRDLEDTRPATAIAVYAPGATDAASMPLCVIGLGGVALAGNNRAHYAPPATGYFYLQQ